MVVMVRCCRSGWQFLFSDKIINPVFNNVLVDGSEIFVNFSFSLGVRKLLQASKTTIYVINSVDDTNKVNMQCYLLWSGKNSIKIVLFCHRVSVGGSCF